MSKYRIRRNDQVTVIAGKDKGKSGRVLRVDREKGRVLVEGINIVKKAMRKKRQEDRGGIMEIEAPIHISNVMLVTRGGERTRVSVKRDGDNRVRVAKKNGEEL
jgi:large subunit ribosomal protein L24